MKALKFIVPALLVAGAAVYFYMTNTSGSQTDSPNIRYATNEAGEENWADADRYLESQLFIVNAEDDHVLTGADGTLIAIPKNAFIDADGNPVTGEVEVELKEAITPENIVKAGLSTMSGDELLETGGMFYLNARKDGENLQINPDNPIGVEVPTDNLKPGMQLFEGRRTAEGDIDWQDPKPLNNDLKTVDLDLLNFQPPAYEKALIAVGASDSSKAWKDSLYYSFHGEMNGEGRRVERFPGYFPRFSSEAGLAVYVEIDPANIRALYDPKFQNTFVATREFEERVAQLHVVHFEEGLDIYLNALDKTLGEADALVAEAMCARFESTIIFSDTLGGLLNRTKMETDSFVPNAEPLPQVSEVVRDEASYDICQIFKDFAAQKLGGVTITGEAKRLLVEHYNQQIRIYQAALDKARLKTEKERRELSKKYDIVSANLQREDQENYAKAFREELEVNLDEAYRQLGRERPRRVAARNRFSATVRRTGWKNVDQYVAQSLAERRTLNYTDRDGNTAVLEFKPFELTVNEAENYDRVVAYLLPDQLTTYQKITNQSGNTFTEKLNMVLAYDVFVVGFKEDKVSSALVQRIAPGTRAVTLQSSDMEKVADQLRMSGKKKPAGALQETVEMEVAKQAVLQQVKAQQEVVNFRGRIAGEVFEPVLYGLEGRRFSVEKDANGVTIWRDEEGNIYRSQ